MAKKKQKPKKNKAKKPYVPKLSAQKYERYYMALEEGEVAAHDDKAVYWDLAPGEIPPRVLADMRYVAKKEKIPVRVELGPGRSLCLFYTSKKAPTAVRVVRDREVIQESET